MAGGIERLAHAGDIAGHAGGGFVVANENGLDLSLFVRRELLRENIDRNALAPFDLDRIDHKLVTIAEIRPQVRELAEDRNQHMIAG